MNEFDNYYISSKGVYIPNGTDLSRYPVKAVGWDLYGVIHPDEEVVSLLYGKEHKGSPTVVSQSSIIGALIGESNIKKVEMDVFGSSSGANMSAALEQVDLGLMEPQVFIKYYLINKGLASHVAERESDEFISQYVDALKTTIDRRILDGLIPELRRLRVLSQVITDRTALALAVAKKVPDYLSPDRFPLGIVSSQQVKLHKPDVRIYEKGIELARFFLGSSFGPAQGVMIDDREYNLIGSQEDNFTQGAVNAGMCGIWFHGYEELLYIFKDLGIKVELRREV